MRRHLVSVSIAAALASGCATPGPSVEAPGAFEPAWFGLKPAVTLAKPPVSPPADAVIPPPLVPPGEEEGYGALDGERIYRSVEEVVSFAQDMRAAGSQLWGRISGSPSEIETARWLRSEFDGMGLMGVSMQTYQGEGELWWPNAWEARVLADAAFGDQTIDVVLASATPVSRSMLASAIEAPVVFAGEAGEAASDGVRGKIALQRTRPAAGAYSDRAKVRDSSRKLIEAGAVAVLTWVEQSGNMRVFDFGQCGGVCFNLGGADGRFLSEAIRAAGEKGAPEIRMRLSLDAEMKSGLSAANVIGLVQGQSDDIIIVNAHLDSWFDGAGDNADGVGVLVALARHFANREAPPARTLMFVGSGGHHSSGLNGPANAVRMNPDLMERVKLVVNLEHLAQFQIDALPVWKVHTGEQPKTFGISNGSPFLANLAKEAAERYGFVIRPDIVNTVPGDLGGYAPLNAARIQAIHSGPLYHTSGDTLDSLSIEGLEKAARFYAYVIDRAAKASEAEIHPPATATAETGR